MSNPLTLKIFDLIEFVNASDEEKKQVENKLAVEKKDEPSNIAVEATASSSSGTSINITAKIAQAEEGILTILKASSLLAKNDLTSSNALICQFRSSVEGSKRKGCDLFSYACVSACSQKTLEKIYEYIIENIEPDQCQIIFTHALTFIAGTTKNRTELIRMICSYPEFNINATLACPANANRAVYSHLGIAINNENVASLRELLLCKANPTSIPYAEQPGTTSKSCAQYAKLKTNKEIASLVKAANNYHKAEEAFEQGNMVLAHRYFSGACNANSQFVIEYLARRILERNLKLEYSLFSRKDETALLTAMESSSSSAASIDNNVIAPSTKDSSATSSSAAESSKAQPEVLLHFIQLFAQLYHQYKGDEGIYSTFISDVITPLMYLHPCGLPNSLFKSKEEREAFLSQPCAHPVLAAELVIDGSHMGMQVQESFKALLQQNMLICGPRQQKPKSPELATIPEARP